MADVQRPWSDLQIEVTVTSTDVTLDAIGSLVQTLLEFLQGQPQLHRLVVMRRENSLKETPGKNLRVYRILLSLPKFKG